METTIFLLERASSVRCSAVKGVLCKNILVADLSGSQYLFKILQTSLTVKNSENVVKSGCLEK